MHFVIDFEKDQIGCTYFFKFEGSSYFGIYFSRSNKGDISSFIDHSFTLLSHHFSPKITLASTIEQGVSY